MTAHLSRIPKLRRHSSGLAFVEFLGERHYSPFVHGTEEARQWYGAFLAQLTTGGPEAALQFLRQGRRASEPVAAEPLSLVELIAVYTENLEGPDGTRPVEHLARPVMKLMRLTWGRDPAASFGPAKLRQLQRFLLSKRWTRKSINRGCQIARNVFRFGVAEELIPPSVWHALQAVQWLRRGESKAPEAVPVAPVPLEHVEAALAHMPPQVAGIVRVTLLSAARTGEICRMRVQDLDMSGDVWEFRPADHKGAWRGRERIVYLGPKAQAVIRPFLVLDRDAPIFRLRDAMEALLAERHSRRATPLSCGNVPGSNRKASPKREPGEFFTTAVVRDTIHRACDAAGVPRWNPHQLRHAAATAIRREFGLDTARAVLGHTDATTATIYAERDATLTRAVALKQG
jgi:integrase